MAGNFEGNPRTGHIIVRPEEYARVNYKIVLKDKRGRLCTARFAHTYEIFYGRKKIYASTEIPRARKSAADKKSFLLKKITSFENKRLAAVRSILHARKREQQRKKRIADAKAKKRADTNLKKVSKRTAIKDYENSKKEFARQDSLMADEELDFERATSEDPLVLENATVGDVLVIPFKPKTAEYIKRLIDKTITRFGGTDILYLTTLDFTLRKNFIEMNKENFLHASNETIMRMFPHLEQFFKGMVKTANVFMLRIKFMQQISENKWTEHGISLDRQEINSLQELAVILKGTLIKLKGKDYIEKKKLKTRNYLETDSVIFIKGFTLEATEFS